MEELIDYIIVCVNKKLDIVELIGMQNRTVKGYNYNLEFRINNREDYDVLFCTSNVIKNELDMLETHREAYGNKPYSETKHQTELLVTNLKAFNSRYNPQK